jgi:hypothetical protein
MRRSACVLIFALACNSSSDRQDQASPKELPSTLPSTRAPDAARCAQVTRVRGHPSSDLDAWYSSQHFEPIELRMLDLGPPTKAEPLLQTITLDNKTYTGLMVTQAACIEGDVRFGVDASGLIFMLSGPTGIVDYTEHTCVTPSGKVPCETTGRTNRFYVFPDGKKYGGMCDLTNCAPVAAAPGLCPEESDSPACRHETVHTGTTYSFVISIRAIGGTTRDFQRIPSDQDAPLAAAVERCYVELKVTSSEQVSIKFDLDASGSRNQPTSDRNDALATCVAKQVAEQVGTTTNIGPAGAHMSIDVSFFAHSSWPAVSARRPTPLKAFNTVKDVLAGGYHKLPAKTKPVARQGFSNPVTGNKLRPDTSAGGGYACCEQASFFVWFDPAEGLVWVRRYQASLRDVSDNWYGPFALVKP